MDFYPSTEPCIVCSKINNNGSEPRLGYVVCQEHKNLTPLEINKIQTPVFELPNTCPECQAVRTVWDYNSQFGCEKEYATYQCYAKASKYPKQKHFSIDIECSKSAKNMKIAQRNKEIDLAVLEVLEKLKCTPEEFDKFATRTDRGRWDKNTVSIFNVGQK